MYNIQKDAASNYHADLENAAGSLNPPVVLEELAIKRSGGCRGLGDVQTHRQN